MLKMALLVTNSQGDSLNAEFPDFSHFSVGFEITFSSNFLSVMYTFFNSDGDECRLS